MLAVRQMETWLHRLAGGSFENVKRKYRFKLQIFGFVLELAIESIH